MGAVAFVKANPAAAPWNASFGGQPTPVINNKRVVRGYLTFSASYATGGDSLALTGVGLTEVTGLWVDASSQLLNASGLSIDLTGTKSAPTIRAYDANATEVANATNLSARSAVPVMLLGA